MGTAEKGVGRFRFGHRGVDISKCTGTIIVVVGGLDRLANPNMHKGPAS